MITINIHDVASVRAEPFDRDGTRWLLVQFLDADGRPIGEIAAFGAGASKRAPSITTVLGVAFVGEEKR